MYLSKIRKPILEDLQISRTQLKSAGLPSREADEIADRIETKEEKAQQALYPRLISLPTIPAPRPGTSRTILSV